MIESSVATPAALANLGMSGMAEPGSRLISLWVWSRRDFFYLDSSISVTPDGIKFIADGSGTWIRQCKPDPYWQSITAWYYNATTGNNDNTGISAGAPIKNIAELALRAIGGTADVTLNVAAALSDTEAALFAALEAGYRQWTVVEP